MAVEVSRLYVLDKTQFMRLMTPYPALLNKMRQDIQVIYFLLQCILFNIIHFTFLKCNDFVLLHSLHYSHSQCIFNFLYSNVLNLTNVWDCCLVFWWSIELYCIYIEEYFHMFHKEIYCIKTQFNSQDRYNAAPNQSREQLHNTLRKKSKICRVNEWMNSCIYEFYLSYLEYFFSYFTWL